MTSSTARPHPQSGAPTDCLTAHFSTHWPSPSMAVVSAHGEVDAANAQEFIDYVVHHAAHVDKLVLDLSGVDFFATAGFSALHTINVQCAGESVCWAVVPGRAVDRLLQICDPDSALLTCGSVDDAVTALEGEPRRLLQLVTKPR